MDTDSIFPGSWGINQYNDNFINNPASLPIFPLDTNQSQSGIYYGETIRGMSYVSPLVTYKHTNLTTEEILNRYFPDSTPVEDNGSVVYCDVNSDFDGVKRVSGSFSYEGTNKFAFTIYVFYSTDATKLAEAYECLQTDEQEIVFFIEDNTGDFSERYGAVKISEDLAKNLINGLEADVKDNKRIYTELQEIFPDLTDNEIREMLYDGKIEYRNTKKIAHYLQGVYYFNATVLSLILPGAGFLLIQNNQFLSTALEKGAKSINSLKFDDYQWNPDATKKNEDGTDDTSYAPEIDFEPVLLSGVEDLIEDNEEAINNVIKDFSNKLLELSNEAKDLLGVNDFGNGIYNKLNATLNNISTTIENFDYADLLKLGVRVLNAFLCGLWNSLVDAVSGILYMAKYILDAIDLMQNIGTDLPIITEHIDNIVQALADIDFETVINHFVKQFNTLTKNNTVIPYIPIAYFVGAIYGFVISLIVEIAIGIVISGGALSVAAIVERLAQMFTSIFRAGAKLAKGVMSTMKIVAKKTAKVAYKILSEITAFLRKGTDAFIEIIDELFAKIKTATILSSSSVVAYAQVIPIESFFKAIKLFSKKLWIKELEKIGLQIAKLSEEEYTFVHNGVEIFKGNLKDAKTELAYYFKNAKKNGGLQEYMDELADISKVRKTILAKWISKFDKGFFNHLDGEFGIKVFEGSPLVPFRGEYLVSQGGHTSEAIGKTLRLKGNTIPNPTMYDLPYKTKIEVRYSNSYHLEKDFMSSMFPENWKLERIKEEIAYVYENTVVQRKGQLERLEMHKFYKFVGESTNGFDILIEVDDLGNIVNAYPYKL